MKFLVQGGQLTDRKRWFPYERDGQTVEFLLNVPDSDEWLSAVSRYKIIGTKPNYAGFRKHVAKHYFLDMRGAKDSSGADLDVSSDVTRALILQADPGLFGKIQRVCNAALEEEEEGNAGSGSD